MKDAGMGHIASPLLSPEPVRAARENLPGPAVAVVSKPSPKGSPRDRKDLISLTREALSAQVSIVSLN